MKHANTSTMPKNICTLFSQVLNGDCAMIVVP
jgi:hypothetical protein